MPLNFPANPSVNDTYTFSGRTWTWNGTYWDQQPNASQAGAINDVPIGNVTAASGAFTTLTSSGNTTLAAISGNLVPAANVTYNLGTANLRWNELFLAGNTIDLGGAIMTSDPTEGTIALIPAVKAGETATKAIVIGQQGIATVDTDANGVISAANLQAAATNPNTTTTNLFVSSTASVTGNITGGNISVTGTITGYATTSYVDSELANVVASAPAGLDTLGELAAAIGNDASFSTTVNASIGAVASNVTILQGNVTTLTADLANVNYYDDANVAAYLPTYSGAFTTVTATGNITAGNVLATGFFYANGDPFVSGGGASNVVVGTRTTPVYVALATSTTLDIVARTGNVTVTLTT